MTDLVLVTDASPTGGAAPLAAALGVAIASRVAAGDEAKRSARLRDGASLHRPSERARTDAPRVLVVNHARGGGAQRPTMLASEAARELEHDFQLAGGRVASAVARGRVCFLSLPADPNGLAGLVEASTLIGERGFVVAHVPAGTWAEALDLGGGMASAALLRVDLDHSRPLAALAVGELRERGLRVQIARQRIGLVATRRVAAGLDPGGAVSREMRRLDGRLLPRLAASAPGSAPVVHRGGLALPPAGSPGVRTGSESGQVVPAILATVVLIIGLAIALSWILGAATGKGRAQRSADLIALSAARSMRDDFSRLFTPARLPDGSINPAHLSKTAYLSRGRAAGQMAALRNGVAGSHARITFPDAGSFAPVQARATVFAELELPMLGVRSTGGAADPSSPRLRGVDRASEIKTTAVAEAVPTSAPAEPPSQAIGEGGYSGPLASRQGMAMRPDVAAAFDRLAADAEASGLTISINSAYRSNAEQARLFAANPDPRWVAPPGRSLHRCATELDLGPASAYGWLARAAPAHGFLRRYPWEAWHFGYVAGPPPCSAAPASGGGGADGRLAGAGDLPAFVPAQFRGPLRAAANRSNVSAGLLAAQLLAESNFNPYAVSSAGAQGIAQFIPATALAYGLGDPFDAEQAIFAQARLMSDLLRRFGDTSLALAAYNAGPGAVAGCGCVPAYPETQAYVARILGLLGGRGQPGLAQLEVRLVS